MKRAIFVLLLFIGPAVLCDERSEKRQLISELLEVMDAKALTHASFGNFLTTATAIFNDGPGESPGESPSVDIPEEYRAQYEAEQRRQAEERQKFQDRLFAQLNYPQFFDQTYVPLFEDQFTVDELRQLIAFFKTRSGQKLVKIMPQLGVSSGWRFIHQAGDAAQKEIEKEQMAKYPWRSTMRDLRTLATAVEARATDVNEYPDVAFEELEAVIAPVYIRNVPKADAWGTPYLYVGNAQHYRFVSAGADRRFEWGSRHLDIKDIQPRLMESLDADIIFQDGTFLQSPKVAQEQE
jgi:hypothetical protein